MWLIGWGTQAFSSCDARASPVAEHRLSAGSPVAMSDLNCPAACSILVPQPGIEPESPTSYVQRLSHWIPREVLQQYLMVF